MAKGFVILQRRRRPPSFSWPVIRLTRSLPYVISRNGVHTHRVRFGEVILNSRQDPRPLHAVFVAWCGQMIIVGHRRSLERNAELQATAHPDFPVCRTCEERATLQGHPSSELICDRVVRFSPPRGTILRHRC